MCDLLQELKGVVCFQDDILIHAPTEELHDEYLKAVIDRISKAGMKLNKGKCQFKLKELEFLGHSISSEGIRPSPTKVQAIVNLPTPTQDTLKSVLGMINYLGQYVPGLQNILKPINMTG
jgi:hypothetical protein